MVPVGGAVIAGFDKSLIQAIGKIYPGIKVLLLMDFVFSFAEGLGCNYKQLGIWNHQRNLFLLEPILEPFLRYCKVL